MEAASSRPVSGGGDLLRCGFCPSLRAPYTCPRCLLRFCSVPCFRGHGSCARDFRERELRLRLRGLRGDEASSRVRLREALLRLRELREPGDEQAQLGLGPEEAPLWEQLTPEEQKAFRKLLNSGGAASLVPLWTPWWEEGPAPRGLVREVGPRDPPKAGGGDPTEPRDPQNPLGGEERGPQVTGGEKCDLAEDVDPQNPLQGGKWDLIEEIDPQKTLERKDCDLIVEMDPQKTLEREESDLIVEMDPQKTLEREESDLLKEIVPRNPLQGEKCDLIVEMDPRKTLEREESDLIKEMDPRNPLHGEKCDLIVEMDPRKPLERKGCDLIVEMDPQNPLQCSLIEEIDPQDPLPRGKQALIEEIDPQKPLEREESDVIVETDPQKPLEREGTNLIVEIDPQDPLQRIFIEKIGSQNASEVNGCAFIDKMDPRKLLGGEHDLTEPRDPQNPLQGAFIKELDPQNPLEAGECDRIEQKNPQNLLQAGERNQIEQRDPQNPIETEERDCIEQNYPQNPLKERDCIEQKDPQNPLEAEERDRIGQRDPQNPFKTEEQALIDQKDPRNPLQGVFIEETGPPKPLVEERDPRNPLEAEERVLMDGRGLDSLSQGEEGVPRGPAKPLCETEAARLLSLIPPEIPPLSSFRTSVSPSVGFQLPGVLYGYVYALSLYNGDVEGEEDVLGEFCETLLDVSPPLGSSPPRVYASVSEALQDASRSVVDHRYPECPLGRGGAMSAVARLLSQKAFLLAALCHLGKLLCKGRKHMADADRSQAFRAGKKCAFLLSWANENEGLLPLLALAAREEGRSQREAGQEVGALRRGLERKWRGKRPPREEKKKEKALIEELD
ncbi:zinc finger HIT domain-containing protein 2 [Anolis sagrei]|uniref:zinc finger HIT domain-containing protein 2 n=1 Tax=Anolis sagrei TaxID=38937 RepID=UPI00352232CC